MRNDFFSFFLSWMSAPRRVGAIAPSGAALADLITREITATTGPVLELGPGTGAFTYKLIKWACASRTSRWSNTARTS